MSIEARPDDAVSTFVELDELRARVWKLDDGLFMFDEVPVQTPFTIDVMFDRLEELAAGIDRFAYLVDLSRVKRPDARVRERLRHRVGRIRPRLVHVGLVVGGNAVIRAVATIAAFVIGFRSFTIHASIDEAVEACRRALQ
jgi:hypothetical protein